MKTITKKNKIKIQKGSKNGFKKPNESDVHNITTNFRKPSMKCSNIPV